MIEVGIFKNQILIYLRDDSDIGFGFIQLKYCEVVCFKIYFEESVYMIYRMNRNYKRRGFLRIMF